jgi:hypothetical protein
VVWPVQGPVGAWRLCYAGRGRGVMVALVFRVLWVGKYRKGWVNTTARMGYTAQISQWRTSHGMSFFFRNQEPETLCYSGDRDMACTIPNDINLQYCQLSIDKR